MITQQAAQRAAVRETSRSEKRPTEGQAADRRQVTSKEQAQAFVERLKSYDAFADRVFAVEDAEERLAIVRAQTIFSWFSRQPSATIEASW